MSQSGLPSQNGQIHRPGYLNQAHYSAHPSLKSGHSCTRSSRSAHIPQVHACKSPKLHQFCIDSAATLRIDSFILLLLFAKRCPCGNTCSTSRDNTPLTLDGLTSSQLFMKFRDPGWNTYLRSEVGYSHWGSACESPALEQHAYAVLSC